MVPELSEVCKTEPNYPRSLGLPVVYCNLVYTSKCEEPHWTIGGLGDFMVKVPGTGLDNRICDERGALRRVEF